MQILNGTSSQVSPPQKLGFFGQIKERVKTTYKTHEAAIKIFGNILICLPFFFLFNNLFWTVGIPLGIIFAPQVKEIDRRIGVIARNYLPLVILAVPLMIKSFPAVLVIGAIYCSARLAASIYLEAQKKEDRKNQIRNIVVPRVVDSHSNNSVEDLDKEIEDSN
jgi:hypothetical protein